MLRLRLFLGEHSSYFSAADNSAADGRCSSTCSTLTSTFSGENESYRIQKVWWIQLKARVLILVRTSNFVLYYDGGVGYKLLSQCTQSVVIMHYADKHIQLVCTINCSEGENITEK